MTTPAAPTQMIILPIKATASIENPSTREGQIWTQTLDMLEQWPGFRRLYWGRHVEEPDKTQVHIGTQPTPFTLLSSNTNSLTAVRDSLHQHYTFLSSPQWQTICTIVQPICTEDSPIKNFTVRHAMMSDFTPNPQSLGKGAPVTGTAIYFATDPAGWEKTWALWTTIVPNVPGCLGCAGGWMVEPVEGHGHAYIVWVGWKDIAMHDAYHHTKDFRRRGPILREHNRGWREYGHVAFGHSRSRRVANL